MAPIKQIDVHQVKQLEDKDSATIVDIRDPTSFNAGHINAITNLISDQPFQLIELGSGYSECNTP